ncbi:MAG: TIR domain-containing protein [Verrucomicrobiales bacterium]|nr:TIR domain-containing protein [Verrucomicrobiales bacterium]
MPETPFLNSNLKPEYWAFISYRHLDNQQPGRQWANWLHQMLEAYEVPEDLVGQNNGIGETIPDRIYPVFRDEEDLPADADLTRGIRSAIERSKYLIVLCSPQSAQSKYVSEEIKYFKQLGRRNRIVAVLIEGEPNSSWDIGKQKLGFSPFQESFPLPLIHPVLNDGEIDLNSRIEPLAADLRLHNGLQGWTTTAAYKDVLEADGTLKAAAIAELVEQYKSKLELGSSKILSAILGIPLRTLTRRDKNRLLKKAHKRNKNLARWLALTMFMALSTLIALLFALQQKAVARNEQSVAEWRLYANQIEGARREFLGNRFVEFIEILNATNPRMRGWEFDYLQNKIGKQRIAIGEHESYVRSVSYNRSGELLASGGWDDVVKIWTAKSGKLLKVLVGVSGIDSLAFDSNGNKIAAGGFSNFMVWDVRSGEAVINIPTMVDGVGTNIRGLDFSPLGDAIATGHSDHTIKLYNLNTGDTLFTRRLDQSISSLRFSPDGSKLALGLSNGWKIIDSKSGNDLVTPRDIVGSSIAVSFDRSGNRLATGGGGDVVQIWDAHNGKEIIKMKGVHSDYITSVDFSPDGEKLASGGADHTVKVWNTRTGDEEYTFLGHTDNVNTVSFGFDGSIASGSSDKSVSVWKLKKTESSVLAHSDIATSVAFHPDGERFVSGGWDLKAKVWDTASAKLLFEWEHSNDVTSVAFSPDGKYVLSASSDRTIRVMNANSGETVQILNSHTSGGLEAIFSPDGTEIVSSGWDGTVRVWDVKKGLEKRVIRNEGRARSLCFSRDGNFIISGLDDGRILGWLKENGEQMFEFDLGDFAVDSLCYSEDGNIIFAGCGDHIVRILDATSGRQIHSLLGHSDVVSTVDVSPDGKQIVSGSYDKSVRLWNIETGQQTIVLNGHKAVTSVDFSNDGRKLISAGFGGKVIVW